MIEQQDTIKKNQGLYFGTWEVYAISTSKIT